MRRNYRFSNLETKTNAKKSVLFVILTIALLTGLYFIGLPLIIRVASFFGDFKTGKTAQKTDSIPPGPPSFDSLPQATNDSRISIKGLSEPGATIVLNVNDAQEETTADTNGTFSLSLDLQKGENIIWATAKDQNGNLSHESEKIKITFDNTDPFLNVESPAEGAEFNGATQRQITIKGKTDTGVEVIINGRFVNVQEDGTFAFATTLSEGENKFEIKAKDQAENTTETTLTINFAS